MPKPILDDLSAEYVREALDYDPDTGIFKWKRRPDVRPEWNTRFANTVAGTKHSDGRVFIAINSTSYAAHRLAWLIMTGYWPSDEIDHKDVGHSNKWENLRGADRSQNLCNRRRVSWNTTGYKGVSKRGRRWRATIGKAGAHIHLGYFDTPEQAFAAWQKAARQIHGDFIRPE